MCSEKNIHAMRMGPGKHLKGLTLFDGIVTPEEVCLDVRSRSGLANKRRQFDYFHEVSFRIQSI